VVAVSLSFATTDLARSNMMWEIYCPFLSEYPRILWCPFHALSSPFSRQSQPKCTNSSILSHMLHFFHSLCSNSHGFHTYPFVISFIISSENKSGDWPSFSEVAQIGIK
jgi:hypothetical protein